MIALSIFAKIICVLCGYGIGCIQTAYIIGKVFAKVDIREHGSKNSGTTNTVRLLGAKYGMFVFAFDIIKAAVAFNVFCWIFGTDLTLFFWNDFPQGAVSGLYAGIGVIAGHNFPFYMKFKGGKGIASSLGIILSLDLRIAGIIFLVGLIILLTTKYVSVMSLTVLTLLPISMVFCHYPVEAVILACLLAASAYFMHRENIVRLFKHTERKLSIRWKGSLNSNKSRH
ncbi:MAG: glycerol-3-phosphate 1-O-acyltransferase PlsY [Clostridiales bacterium]|nr:glycerol-3-phosphate 1-O-acyltransferase PlsY [Clostridiales bacterium]